jgi:hypothetical protein
MTLTRYVYFEVKAIRGLALKIASFSNVTISLLDMTLHFIPSPPTPN